MTMTANPMTTIANPVFSVADTANMITLRAGHNEEMLRVTKDGFYVRGVKIEQDAYEAEKVYTAFHQWLMWATLNRNY